MEVVHVYRHRKITDKDIQNIRKLICEEPGISRYAIAKRMCREWNWVQANGEYKEGICRSLLVRLDSAGLVILPERKNTPVSLFMRNQKPKHVEVDQRPIDGSLKQLGAIELFQVRRTDKERVYNGLIEEFHYLGYTRPVGEHLMYVAYLNDRPIGCLGWSSAPRHIGCRDRFIGWDQEDRKRNLHLMAYNTRFLILPWVRVKYLASHLLARCVGQIRRDWEKLYKHPVCFLETFVDTERFKGTCYQAANWIYLGKTTGRGKNDQTWKANRSIKAVYGYPLCKDFRERLCNG
jgi:hypothetical protein